MFGTLFILKHIIAVKSDTPGNSSHFNTITYKLYRMSHKQSFQIDAVSTNHFFTVLSGNMINQNQMCVVILGIKDLSSSQRQLVELIFIYLKAA